MSLSLFVSPTQSYPDHVYHSYCPELLTEGKTAAGTPVHVQFLGNDHNGSQCNLRAVALGAPAIDMNFGCPAKTLNRHRGGSVLLDEPSGASTGKSRFAMLYRAIFQSLQKCV